MARAGIGVYLLEIDRMRLAMERHPTLTQRLCTPEEQQFCMASAHPAQQFAACFAAREATLRALETSFRDGIRLKDISVDFQDGGRPRIMLAGKAAERAQRQGIQEIILSLSHSRELVVANAVAVSEKVKPKLEEVVDPKREFQATFKEARGVIDELERLQDAIVDTLESNTHSSDVRPSDVRPSDTRPSDTHSGNTQA